jgi:hypothetical protein
MSGVCVCGLSRLFEDQRVMNRAGQGSKARSVDSEGIGENSKTCLLNPSGKGAIRHVCRYGRVVMEAEGQVAFEVSIVNISSGARMTGVFHSRDTIGLDFF